MGNATAKTADESGVESQHHQFGADYVPLIPKQCTTECTPQTL